MVHSSPPLPNTPQYLTGMFPRAESGVLVKQTQAILGDYSREKICVILSKEERSVKSGRGGR